MKSQKVMALLLSMALSLSTCVPLGSITALGAETGVTAEAAAVQEEVSESEGNAEMQEETDASSEEENAAEEKTEAADEALPEEAQEEAAEETAEEAVEEAVSNDQEEAAGEAEEADTETVDEETSDEEEAPVPAQETESSETESQAEESETAPAAETATPAAETPAEDKTDITAPAETETVKTDAQKDAVELTSEDFAKAEEIKAGDVKDVDIDEVDQYALYRFVPEEEAIYTFYSTGDMDTYAVMYDPDMKQETSDEDGDESNFKFEKTFKAGETYYFQACAYGSNTGSFQVHLEKEEFYCHNVGESSVYTNYDNEITLQVDACSTSEISYQWFDPDENAIAGATSAVYTFVPAKSGNYHCSVSDGNGNAGDVYYYVYIDTQLRVYVKDTDSPYTDIDAKAKESKTLAVDISIDENLDKDDLTIRWYKEGELIDGAVSDSYTISSIEGSASYECSVADQYGNNSSAFFTIRVNHLTAYPDGYEGNDSCTLNVKPNQSCTMKVIATADDTNGITYTWYDTDYNEVASGNNASYTINSVTTRQRWECQVRDAYGNTRSVYFAICPNSLKAHADGFEEDDTPYIYPAIGSSLTLKVIATADDMSKVSYQWYDTNNNAIDGATSSSYTINSVADENVNYYCEVSDTYNNILHIYFVISPLDLANVQTISAGEERQVDLAGVSHMLFKFTPTASGEYNIYSTDANGDPVMDLISDTYGYLGGDDDSGGSLEFYYTGIFSAGKTYYIRARDYYNSNRSYKLHVDKGETVPIDTAVVSNIVNKTYNGAAQTQSPVVKIDNVTLAAGTDYTVAYSNNKNAGTATVTITGKGNYTGSVKKTFTIAKAAQSFRVSASASTIEVGKTAKVTCSGAKETSKYSFSSTNNTVATVAANGTVTGKAPGTVRIWINTAATTNYTAARWYADFTVKKTLQAPLKCRFTKWNNKKYTSCRISWNAVSGAQGYQTEICWTSGAKLRTFTTTNTFRNFKVENNHVSRVRVRAYHTINGKREYGPWSNQAFITPSPSKLTTKILSKTAGKIRVKVTWNIIYGSNGYNVFMSTNPNKLWRWNKSTNQKATSTSAVITACGGKLKKNIRYYVRIVTRRKAGGVFHTVPMPAKNTYVGSFIVK